MDLDAPENPTPKELAAYERYKRWQDRVRQDNRPRLSQRTFVRYVQPLLNLAGVSCICWGSYTKRVGFHLLGITLGLLPLVVRHTFRIRRTPDA